MIAELDPKLTAALIVAVTAILTLVLKWWLSKYFHLFKLKSEHEYEQRQQIKKILSQNKIRLLDACERLNLRLWNFFNHKHEREWHKADKYYLVSFTYWMVVVFSWIRKLEMEMVYVDTTISSKVDMEFIKYIHVFPQVMCDAGLFAKLSYDSKHPTDHFFRGKLDSMADSLIAESKVMTSTEFEANDKAQQEIRDMSSFIEKLLPNSELSWGRVKCLHLLVIAFLNSFGYDFQRTKRSKYKNYYQNRSTRELK